MGRSSVGCSSRENPRVVLADAQHGGVDDQHRGDRDPRAEQELGDQHDDQDRAGEHHAEGV